VKQAILQVKSVLL